MFKLGLSRCSNSLILRSQLKSAKLQPHIIKLNKIPITSPISLRFNSTSTTNTSQEIQDKLVLFDHHPDLSHAVSSSDIHSNQIGYLESIGMGQGWGPTSIIERLLEYTHVYTGLPWWGTICVLAIAVRIILFPLYVKASSNATRMSEIKPQLDIIMKEIKGGDIQDQMKGMEKRKKLMKKHNVSTLAGLAPVLQLPLAYGFFQALRKMANHPVEGFNDQGYAWFQNLSDVDPYLGLQAIAAIAIISVVRIGGETGQHAMAKSMQKIMTIVPIISIFITKNFSAAIVLYFAINSILSLIQSAIFKSNFLRKLLGMPKKLSIQQLNQSNVNQSQSIKDMVTKFVDDSKEKSIKAARDANKRMEVTKQRKSSFNDGFIKKH
ncbi:uncharacterized protein KGF55_004339 [Candida pseudojiufengensis]|uniref:uncharacterized protein n=1 Tax=Candida pseudojiufengensis TaxID=497109 RepID=UPI00222498C4|nr:uncharacterized protein KGF55_004339 [Candida pseudojiufengensis]KAI5960769.1 hypothetical protein KGF55_004339 [Candida pseudojiufengensis]